MTDTNNSFVSLSSLGFDSRFSITAQGEIIDIALSVALQPNKSGQYKLITADGKPVWRTLKPLYRAIYSVEYAEDTIPDLEGEKWRQIDSRGRYYISSKGRVKSYHGRQARLLKPYKNQRGYLRVDIKTGYRRTYLVHQLVALAFIPNDNPIEKDTVDHIDSDKSNNCVENLRWLSRGDNVRAYQMQRKEHSQND